MSEKLDQDQQKLLDMTTKLEDDPMHLLFKDSSMLNDDYLTNYSKIVTKPLALDIIHNNIVTKKYSGPTHWYNDVCLMYQNAIDYHNSGNPGTVPDLVYLAHFLLWKFKKEHKYMLLKNETWMAKVIKKSNEITEIIKTMPISSRRSSNINNYLKKNDSHLEPMNPRDVTPLVEKLNTALADVEFRQDIFQLLKIAENIEPPNIPNDTIDFEKLKPATQNAIKDYLYRH